MNSICKAGNGSAHVVVPSIQPNYRNANDVVNISQPHNTSFKTSPGGSSGLQPIQQFFKTRPNVHEDGHIRHVQQGAIRPVNSPQNGPRFSPLPVQQHGMNRPPVTVVVVRPGMKFPGRPMMRPPGPIPHPQMYNNNQTPVRTVIVRPGERPVVLAKSLLQGGLADPSYPHFAVPPGTYPIQHANIAPYGMPPQSTPVIPPRDIRYVKQINSAVTSVFRPIMSAGAYSKSTTKSEAPPSALNAMPINLVQPTPISNAPQTSLFEKDDDTMSLNVPNAASGSLSDTSMSNASSILSIESVDPNNDSDVDSESVNTPQEPNYASPDTKTAFLNSGKHIGANVTYPQQVHGNMLLLRTPALEDEVLDLALLTDTSVDSPESNSIGSTFSSLGRSLVTTNGPSRDSAALEIERATPKGSIIDPSFSNVTTPKLGFDAVNRSSAFDTPTKNLVESQATNFGSFRNSAFDSVTSSKQSTVQSPYPTGTRNIALKLRDMAVRYGKSKDYVIGTFDKKGKPYSSITHEKLYHRALKVAQVLRESKSVQLGHRVLLLFKPSEFVDFAISMFGCMFARVIAVPVGTTSLGIPNELTELGAIINSCDATVCLTTDSNIRALTKYYHSLGIGTMPNLDWKKVNEIGTYSFPKKSKTDGLEDPLWVTSLSDADLSDPAYIEFTKNAENEIKGVVVRHDMIINQCEVMLNEQHLSKKDSICISMDPRQHIGLLLSLFCPVYADTVSVIATDSILKTPDLWPSIVAKYKVNGFLTDNHGAYDIVSANKAAPKTQKGSYDLSRLSKVWINCDVFFPGIDDAIISVFKLCKLTNPNVVMPIVSLNDLGGTILTSGVREVNSEHFIRLSRMQERMFSLVYSRKEIDDDALQIRDNGKIVQKSSVAIVEGEKRSIVSDGMIGEIWLDSPFTAKEFWGLPYLSDKLLRARPLIYMNEKDPKPEFEIEETGEVDEFGRKAAFITKTFVRTGLLGFVLTKKHIPTMGPAETRLVVLGSRQDIMFQRNDVSKDIGTPSSMFSIASLNELNLHLANHVCDSISVMVPQITAIICFTVTVRYEPLPVVLVEIASNEFQTIAANIEASLKQRHQIKPFAVVICKPGSLPRVSPNIEAGTGFQSSNSCQYSTGIVSVSSDSKIGVVVEGPGGKAIGINKLEALDVYACQNAFLLGTLKPLFVSLNGSESVVGNILCMNANSNDKNPDSELGEAAQIFGGMKDIPLTDDYLSIDLRHFTNIVNVLMWRAMNTPDEVAYTTIDARGREGKSLSFSKLSCKISALAHYLVEKRNLKKNDHVIIISSSGIEYSVAVFACFFVGIICIPIPPPDIDRIVEDMGLLVEISRKFRVQELLVNTSVEEDLKSKVFQTAARVATTSSRSKEGVAFMPSMTNIAKFSRGGSVLKKEDPIFQASVKEAAIVLVSFDADMQFNCVIVTHKTLLEQCKIQTIQGKMLNSTSPDGNSQSNKLNMRTVRRPFISCVQTTNRIGFLYSILMGVYIGSGTIVISPFDYFMNPQLWFDAIHKYKVKDAFAPYPMLSHAVGFMQKGDFRTFSLHDLDNLLIPIESRPLPHMQNALMSVYAQNRLSENAIACIYVTDVNPMISSRSFAPVDQTTVWIDLASFREGRLKIIKETHNFKELEQVLAQQDEELSYSFMVQDCGKVSSVSVY